MTQATINQVIIEMGQIIAPLSRALSSPQRAKELLNAMGWMLPPGVEEIGLVTIDPSLVIRHLTIVVNSTEKEREDLMLMASRIKVLGQAAYQFFQDIEQLAKALTTTLGGAGNYLNKTQIDDLLLTRLTDLLLIQYINENSPLTCDILFLLGIFTVEAFPQNLANYQAEHIRHTIHYDRISTLFSDPSKLFTDVYGWGTPNFKATLLLAYLNGVLMSLGASSNLRYMPRSVEERLINRSVPDPDSDPSPQIVMSLLKGLGWDPLDIGLSFYRLRATIDGGSDSGLGITPFATGSSEISFALSEKLTLEINSSIDLEGGIALLIRPGQPPSVETGVITTGTVGTMASGEVGFQLIRGSKTGDIARIFSLPGGSRIQAQQLFFGGGVERLADGSFEGFIELGIVGGTVMLTIVEMDNFITKLLPAEGIKAELDFRAGWSHSRGIYFQGSGGLETAIAVRKSLGPFNLETLHIVLAAKTEELRLEVSISGGATLGPLVLSVERIGLTTNFKFQPGNLGPVDGAFDFKPPAGLGLVVAAGPITGGGFLSIDTANGRYAGVLQLNAGMIAITAIGLLDTKLPGGKPGFSFLIIITIKFPPIQLGFGFALTGLGGLAGIHRSIVVKALQDGVRSKSIDNILFPENPVRDAPKLISDLQAIFPPTEGQFVFGPMAIITWGTPTVVEAELGIILELPNPIRLVILGQVNVTLPDKKVPVAVIDLHIDIVGIIDFTNRNLSIDASLHDSRLLAYNLYGDMAMRLSWGDPPNFALSVGGLHPQFQPPPDFPTLRRLTVALGLGENPRISLQAYLAVTSNTVQFGALAELYAEAAGFNVYGWIGFDVLFIFSPFSLTADFSAGVALRRGSTVIAGVHLAATLTGPTPWHAWGEASISILFLSVTVTFDATFGEEAQLVVEVSDPWAALEAEIKKLGNWSATLPPAISQVVSLKAPGADEPGLALIDPLGGLTLRQKAVPFDRTLTKFGQGNLAQAQRFTLGGVTVGAQPATNGSPLLDYFAPGQFEEMTDAAKLSRPSFEQMQAGMTIASDAVAFGTAKGTNYTYKTVIIDAPDAKPRSVERYALKANHQTVALQRSAVAQSQLHTTGLDKFAPPPSEPALVTLGEEEYIIVNTTTMADRTQIILKHTLTPEWKPSIQHSVGDRMLPSSTNGYIYRCTGAGTTGGSEPGWPTAGSSVSDGTVTWQEFDDPALKTKGARNQLLAEYLVDHPEELNTLEVMPKHEVMEAA